MSIKSKIDIFQHREIKTLLFQAITAKKIHCMGCDLPDINYTTIAFLDWYFFQFSL